MLNYTFSPVIWHLCIVEIFQSIKEEHKLDKLTLVKNSLLVGENNTNKKVKVFSITLKASNK